MNDAEHHKQNQENDAVFTYRVTGVYNIYTYYTKGSDTMTTWQSRNKKTTGFTQTWLQRSGYRKTCPDQSWTSDDRSGPGRRTALGPAG